MLELLIVAALAGVVLYQLYAVLGRRVGRQPEDAAAAVIRQGLAEPPLRLEQGDAVAFSGLAAIRSRDSAFDPVRFIDGARDAYQTIVKAFAAGDRKTLDGLLAPAVQASFESAMAQREAEGRTETVEFAQPPRTDIESSDVVGDVAQIMVRFLAEFRSRTKGPEGEGVDDRRTAEVWTFERNLREASPNWVLARVDAAQA